ncbi:hypothetical protein C943_01850 [Mariniradius saccharolyticus AK6]|uniref:Uncharacterized protein n=1 Tax=Mariniradius saccharolyticus AK6 TaxID=1239962 RepID=M7Y3S7_9BACT|nr:hypothetical protein C943_01850 [Mariniradius saccharolyticus AK6]
MGIWKLATNKQKSERNIQDSTGIVGERCEIGNPNQRYLEKTNQKNFPEINHISGG